MSVDTCPDCGRTFKAFSQHWRQSDCEYPSLSEKQKEILKGIVMGDGYVDCRHDNPYVKCKMITEEYLEYIDKQFGILSNGVDFVATAEEQAKQNRKSGNRPNAKTENYSDVYEWRSRSLPELGMFDSWYSSGEKVWPEDIELTPTVLKHWYVGDGHWYDNARNKMIQIGLSKEVDNRKKIESMFSRGPGIEIDNWKVTERKEGWTDCTVEFYGESSERLFDYMGEALPGFEYKWPEK